MPSASGPTRLDSISARIFAPVCSDISRDEQITLQRNLPVVTLPVRGIRRIEVAINERCVSDLRARKRQKRVACIKRAANPFAAMSRPPRLEPIRRFVEAARLFTETLGFGDTSAYSRSAARYVSARVGCDRSVERIAVL